MLFLKYLYWFILFLGAIKLLSVFVCSVYKDICKMLFLRKIKVRINPKMVFEKRENHLNYYEGTIEILKPYYVKITKVDDEYGIIAEGNYRILLDSLYPHEYKWLCEHCKKIVIKTVKKYNKEEERKNTKSNDLCDEFITDEEKNRRNARIKVFGVY